MEPDAHPQNAVVKLVADRETGAVCEATASGVADGIRRARGLDVGVCVESARAG